MKQGTRANFNVFDASDHKVGIAVAQFNQEITVIMLEKCLKKLALYQVEKKNITIQRVSGSVEIPLILQKLSQTKNYDCLVAIGAIIRGETAHFDYVAKIVSEGILRVMLDYQIPIGFGILTVNNSEQAKARVDFAAEAAEAALQSLKIVQEMK